jgi:hypothetical protein
MIVLVLLDIVGIAITDFAPLFSHWYWLAMVVVTGLACITMEWSRAGENGLDVATIIKNQGAHLIQRSCCARVVSTARTPG